VTRRVTFNPEARADLFAIYDYIDEKSGPERAGGYIERLDKTCLRLHSFSNRGVPRDDIAPGVRTLSYQRRTLIVFRVLDAEVEILRILYAGRDFSAGSLKDR